MHDIVIFGASGFIGSHLANRFAESGKRVRVLVRNVKNDGGLNTTHPNIEVIVGDITDPTIPTQILRAGDIVFNLATPSTPYSSSVEPVYEIETHIMPQVRMMQTAAEIGVSKLIYFSSGGGIYGKDNQNPISEEEVIHPSSPHAIAKATIEYYLQYFGSKYQIPQLIYRLSNPYGPGQIQKPGFGLIPTLFAHVLDNEPPILYDNGAAIRDFMYIDDLIEAIFCSYSQTNTYSTYNIGSGVGTPIREIWNLITHITQTQLQPILKERRPFEVKKNVLEISRFTSEYAWSPTTSLKEGLLKTWNWIQAQKAHKAFVS